MKNASNVINNVKASYTVAVMSVLGVFAFVSAVFNRLASSGLSRR